MIDPPTKLGVTAKEHARRSALTLEERIAEDYRLARRAMLRRGQPAPSPQAHREAWLRTHGQEAAR